MSTIKQATEAAYTLRRFMSPSQLSALGSGCRGEEREFFKDKMVEYAERIATMPKTYKQDGKGDEAIVYLHYFTGGADWWITEKDMETPEEPGQHQAFGLVRLGPSFEPELGYISIVELTRLGVELDLYWKPKTLGEISKRLE